MIKAWMAALTAVFLFACATSPLGRRQLNLFPESEMQAMGMAAFQQVKEKVPLSNDRVANNYVRCVADAVTRDVRGGETANQWEVAVFENKSANAFALPGGKIGVYTGMLNVAQTQNQLAAVIAHEVAHVLARHANERASTQFATQTGLDLLGVLTGTPSASKNALLAVLGVGAQVGVILPFDRAQESEADLLGLDIMAAAGFDPRESIQLWLNMDAQGKAAPPEFISTHPSHQTRMADLNARMSHAMQLYDRARLQGRRPVCSPGR